MPPPPSTCPRIAAARRAWIVAVVGAAASVAGCTLDDAPAAATDPTVVAGNAVVERVVDGDTIVVEIDGTRETVRLIGIDTPETVKPNAPVECFGPEASAATKELLPEDTPVRLERDVEARDDYGRLLAYVYRASDGLFVNLELVQQGYAVLLTFPPNVAHVDDFVDAADRASAAGRGLWAACVATGAG